MGDNGYFWMKALHEIVALWLAAGVFGSVVLRAYFKRTGGAPGKLAGMLPHIDATLIVLLVILMAVKPAF
jgi:hypothetical protein